MISKAKIKLINSLSLKKFRKKYELFIAESPKLVTDLIKSPYEIIELYALEQYAEKYKEQAPTIISDAELRKISFLKNPQGVLAILKIPQQKHENNQDLNLILDGIQDPGNLGTILRVAHWYGIKNIICSENSVDVFKPKVVQSSMASFAFLNIYYTDILKFVKNIPLNNLIYGALMSGDNIYTQQLNNQAYLIMGNEGQGIRDELIPFINKPLAIPDFPVHSAKIDSLNVSMATAIICSEFRRQLSNYE